MSVCVVAQFPRFAFPAAGQGDVGSGKEIDQSGAAVKQESTQAKKESQSAVKSRGLEVKRFWTEKHPETIVPREVFSSVLSP